MTYLGMSRATALRDDGDKKQRRKTMGITPTSRPVQQEEDTGQKSRRSGERT
jgi:hypothetical protein